MERVVETMLSDLNSNLAAGKRRLEDMKMDGDRTYVLRDGSVIEIPQEQVDLIWDLCDDAQRISLRLPIYISTDTSVEGGAWKVDGRTEASVIAALLGKKMHRQDSIRLHFPDYKELKKLIPDAFMVVFMP